MSKTLFVITDSTTDTLVKTLGRALGVSSEEERMPLQNAYLCFKTLEGKCIDAENPLQLSRAILTTNGIYDYCAKKTYKSVEKWYESRVAADASLLPLQEELLFGLDGRFIPFDAIHASMKEAFAHQLAAEATEAATRAAEDAAYAASLAEKAKATAERAIASAVEAEKAASTRAAAAASAAAVARAAFAAELAEEEAAAAKDVAQEAAAAAEHATRQKAAAEEATARSIAVTTLVTIEYAVAMATDA
jgi:hypothetical protein